MSLANSCARVPTAAGLFAIRVEDLFTGPMLDKTALDDFLQPREMSESSVGGSSTRSGHINNGVPWAMARI